MTEVLGSDADRYPEVSPHEIRRTPMRMEWEALTMLHWRYPAEEVQALLPDGLRIETFDGSAWVGLVPFQMRVDVPFFPELASVLHFPETNVRTYVEGSDGDPGVYFFSLEASSLPAVVTARTSYQVPYFWADMSIEHTAIEDTAIEHTAIEHTPGDGQPTLGDGAAAPGRPESGRIVYRARRRWPKPRGARSLVEVEIGDRFEPGEADDLDRFLTARWALFGDLGPWITYATMFHEPWPLYHGRVIRWYDELVAASGLSAPTDAPLVHYSPGVSVRCGWPGKD